MPQRKKTGWDNRWGGEEEGELLTKEKQQTKQKPKRPNMYRVMMLNDDYTPMEFVVWVIIKIFHKSQQESTRLMLDVHNKGRGLMGVYTHDTARTKMEQVHLLAAQNEHPLQCVLEVEEGDSHDSTEN